MIQSIIEDEMAQKIETTIRQSFLQQSSLMQSQAKAGSDERHSIPCSNCKVNPIVGNRFMCPQCESFNLCYLCEDQIEHEHALLKVKAKKQADNYLSYSLSQSMINQSQVSARKEGPQQLKAK